MIVLDIEASGVDPAKHSILSLGALDLMNPANQFYDECRIWDGAALEDDAMRINGFTEVEVRDEAKKTEAELVNAFFAWAQALEGDKTLAAQNVWFDAGFLEHAARRAGVEYPFAKRSLDVHSLVWLHMTERGVVPPVEKGHSALSSSAIQDYCGIPQEPHPHNALTGALWHAEVVSRIAYTKKLVPEYANYEIPWLKK